MGVLVERCRYLEEAGCASICINSCKVPTQEFFARDMGLALEMTPNYDDFSVRGMSPEQQGRGRSGSVAEQWKPVLYRPVVHPTHPSTPPTHPSAPPTQCQFAFGKTPKPQAADEAFATACFAQCPSKKRAFGDANAKAGDCPNIAVLR